MSEDQKSLAQLMRELFASPEFKAKMAAQYAKEQEEWSAMLRRDWGIVFDKEEHA